MASNQILETILFCLQLGKTLKYYATGNCEFEIMILFYISKSLTGQSWLTMWILNTKYHPVEQLAWNCTTSLPTCISVTVYVNISHNKIIFISFKDYVTFYFSRYFAREWIFKNSFFRHVFDLNHVIRKTDIFCPYWLYMGKRQLFLNIIIVWPRWKSIFCDLNFLLSTYNCCFFPPLYT